MAPFIGLAPLMTPPALSAPSAAIGHSGELGANISKVSPGLKPFAASPAAQRPIR
jgi:hypothetical protein